LQPMTENPMVSRDHLGFLSPFLLGPNKQPTAPTLQRCCSFLCVERYVLPCGTNALESFSRKHPEQLMIPGLLGNRAGVTFLSARSPAEPLCLIPSTKAHTEPPHQESEVVCHKRETCHG
jgi:hypothetical protein